MINGIRVNFLFFLLIFFSFLPYINFLRIPTDAQPNALIISVLIIAIYNRSSLPKKLIISLVSIIVAFSLGLVFVREMDFNTISSLISYFSLFFILLASFLYFKRSDGRLSWTIFGFFFLLNFVVSVLQLTISRSLFSSLFFRVGTSLDRGVTGLTPEPTFNATIASFFLVVYLLNFYPKKSKIIYFLVLIWILFLAMSTTMFLVLIVTLGGYFMFRFPKLLFLLIIPFVLFLTTKLKFNDAESRIGKITNVILNEPSTFLILDQSVNDRISHIFIPIYITFDDFLIPHGPNYSYFNERAYELKQTKFPKMFYFSNNGLDWKRIMSGWGMLFYECGLFGLIFFLYFCITWIRYFEFRSPEFLAALIFTSVMFTAVSINTAFVPFIMGNIFYIAWKKRKMQLAVT